MLYDTAPATVPAGYRVALVWRLTCPETGRVTLATETRHKIRTRGTHVFRTLIATPHAARWMPSGEWDAQREHLGAAHVGWALVHYGDDDQARMAHAAALEDAAALDTDAAAAPASHADAASALPPRRFTADDTPARGDVDAYRAPVVDLYEVEIPSSSRAGVAYTVTHDASGWACTCPHWRYRKPADGCKHINAARIARRRPAARAAAA